MAYSVILEDPAVFDLQSILLYITKTLKEPAVAEKIYRTIKAKINTLDENLQRCKLVDMQPFHAMGVRRLFAENYSVFFAINEKTKSVHVLRVLYSRREWQGLL